MYLWSRAIIFNFTNIFVSSFVLGFSVLQKYFHDLGFKAVRNFAVTQNLVWQGFYWSGK